MTHVHFDRKIYFDAVRTSLFAGSMTQEQVDGQEAILAHWERDPLSDDLRHLAYPLATTKHETASTMQPIEEYGKGEGQEYGVPDPETGQTYYGRGFVQLTWRDNYARATSELELTGDDDLEWHADRALDPDIAANVMFVGMDEGWFRPPNTLELYFNESADDAYGAREIINGDQDVVPDWSHGVSIGNLIAGYHDAFLEALLASAISEPVPGPDVKVVHIEVNVSVPEGVEVKVTVNEMKE
jgi:putative chitinase